ncbi:MAG TPA: hypothetical protein VN699_14670 [Pirellulales bacterium]|nr:hypothetical protein [Pirellulales bacterium]
MLRLRYGFVSFQRRLLNAILSYPAAERAFNPSVCLPLRDTMM